MGNRVRAALQFRQSGLVERPIQIPDRGVLAADLSGNKLAQVIPYTGRLQV
jgi:hypothetical protein